MRLLPKKEASIETAKQKKVLIDEGMALATKVDVLRETVSIEEANVERFRKTTLQTAQREIDHALQKRDSLRKEILDLEKERAILMMPLDEEWEKVKAAYLKYSDQVGALESAKQTVAQQIGENTMLAHDLEIQKGKIEEMKRITEEKLLHADDDLHRAREESAKMRNLAQTVLTSAELREKLVIERENDFKATVEWVEDNTARIEEADKDMVRREKVLADRYATLERTIKRMKK
jgi:hypothetical protein